MEHSPSWFQILLGTGYGNLERLVRSLPGADRSWVKHEPVGIEHVLGSLLVLALLVVVASRVYMRARDTQAALVPEDKLTLSNIGEIIVGYAYGAMTDIMGAKAAKKFLPLIGTCAFFILFSNLLGMIPGFTPPTDTFNTTVACAVIVFLTTHAYGVKEHGLAYFKHFLGPIDQGIVGIMLAPLIFVVEIISHLARPFSLAVRLMANMFADHLVLGIFMGLVPFVVPLPMMLLGLLVVVVQTLVFCLLSTVYIAMAIEHAEH